MSSDSMETTMMTTGKSRRNGAGDEVVVAIEGSSEAEIPKPKTQMSSFLRSPSPETSPTPKATPHKPPKIPTEALPRRRSLARSTISKPKSRFVEEPCPIGSNFGEESVQFGHSPSRGAAGAPITPKTPLTASPGGEEEDEEIYRNDEVPKAVEKSWKGFRVFRVVEWTALVCILGGLIASLTVRRLQHCMVWGLDLWKWCVLVMVIVCSRLVTEWFMHVLVFLVERNFLLKKKVLYFVYGLKKSVQVCIWLTLVLITWVLLIDRGVERSRTATRILNYVSRGIASLLIGAVVWLVKTTLMKILAASFHVNAFFDRIQESLFHQYVLQTLSGPPMIELAEKVGYVGSTAQLSFRNMNKEKGGGLQETIDVNKLQKMNQEKVSAWAMRGLINVIRTSGLSTISNTLDQIEYGGEQKDKEITSEWEARCAAYQIFKNVAKPESKYIEEEDLLRFMSKEDVDRVLPLFEGAMETGKVKKKALRNWVVKVYLDRKSLAHSLNDTKTAVKQLNTIVTAIVVVAIIIIWLLIMGVATVKVFVFISSQMLLVAFMFGNTARAVFESIIFVFVMHPFDVGDRCVIDGVQMIVEEMNILTTIFLRYDNEKIYYPNVVLATKPISNFYRSPDMGDNVEFAVDVSTSMETIGALKAKIKMYIDSKPQHWRPNHSVVVKEIENLNKIKMALYVTHTMNHQNFGEKNNRRSELAFEMKKIFEELSIKYHLLPQEVHVKYVGPAAPFATPH
ncbi:hypothetical protein Sjap_019712 [Stephania japonica]|uniref:Mechanosensitive ion channel protein n=1 Tax=Stephania japonica TaxID=461633 RepID=A0AAP0F6M2_9MAGN